MTQKTTNTKLTNQANPSSKSNNTRAFADLEKYLSGYLNSESNDQDHIKNQKEYNANKKLTPLDNFSNVETNNNRLPDAEISEEFESPSRQKQSELMIIQEEQVLCDRRKESRLNSMEDYRIAGGIRPPFVDKRQSVSSYKRSKRSIPESCIVKCAENNSSIFLRNESSAHGRPVLSQTQKLAAATKTSSILLHRQKHKKKNATKVSGIGTSAAAAAASTTWNIVQNHDGGLILGEVEPFFFGPTFLSKKKRPLVVDGNLSCSRHNENIGCALDSDALQAPEMNKTRKEGFAYDLASDHHSQCSLSLNENSPESSSAILQQPKCRRGRKTKGPFTKLLHMTRVSLEADCARLRSGSYPYRPFEMRKHDVNDPRNRANTIMDVTVLGHPAPLASCEDVMVVMLGFVHNYVENRMKLRPIRTPGRSRRVCHGSSPTGGLKEGGMDASFVVDKEPLDMDKISLVHTPTKEWLCFRRDTCADLGIVKGIQLRIYNPYCISLGNSSSIIPVNAVVVCTGLCEAYPSDLPPLVVPSYIPQM